MGEYQKGAGRIRREIEGITELGPLFGSLTIESLFCREEKDFLKIYLVDPSRSIPQGVIIRNINNNNLNMWTEVRDGNTGFKRNERSELWVTSLQ